MGVSPARPGLGTRLAEDAFDRKGETTLNMNMVKLVGGILLGGVAVLTVLSACGGANAGTSSALETPQATATATSQPTPTSVLAATSSPVPTPTATAGGGDLLAQGKLIFEKTAGGVGCAACHGLNGKGIAQMNSPNVRGKNEGDVRIAIQGGVPMMAFIKLTDEEITAVVAYLRYLNEQP